ncbi:hypothetical protein HPP92_020921 [Vanilla planifolia]|uniref:Uncharacterized protein n=1 Tax=Vanilla planifolia TaxID=51239 RepID=A0A835UIY2_VANPL|nr:hypothetical protein HPP92_020921 [Vanilla planifolia]
MTPISSSRGRGQKPPPGREALWCHLQGHRWRRRITAPRSLYGSFADAFENTALTPCQLSRHS